MEIFAYRDTYPSGLQYREKSVAIRDGYQPHSADARTDLILAKRARRVLYTQDEDSRVTYKHLNLI